MKCGSHGKLSPTLGCADHTFRLQIQMIWLTGWWWLQNWCSSCSPSTSLAKEGFPLISTSQYSFITPRGNWFYFDITLQNSNREERSKKKKRKKRKLSEGSCLVCVLEYHSYNICSYWKNKHLFVTWSKMHLSNSALTSTEHLQVTIIQESLILSSLFLSPNSVLPYNLDIPLLESGFVNILDHVH